MEYLNPNNLHTVVILSRIRPQDAGAQVATYDQIIDEQTVHLAIIVSALDVSIVNGLLLNAITPTETDLLGKFLNSAGDFLNLPDWASWTAQEATDNITNAIFGGKTLAQIETDIDNLPATIAGMKTGLKSAAAQIITIRTLLTFIAKAIVYIRDYTLRMRR